MIRHLLLVCILISFSNCKKGLQYKKNIEDLNYFEQEAKFFDIPLPINVNLLCDPNYTNSYSFFVNQKLTDLIIFYEQQMEVYGWNKVETFQNSLEAIIFFRKPNKSLSILIKSDKFKIDYSHVTIFIKEN